MAEADIKEKDAADSCLLAFLFLILLLAAAALVFLKVETIEVLGEAKYTEEEIIEASGVHSGSPMLLVRGGSVSRALCDRFTYIYSVSVEKKLPSTLRIIVSESVPAAYISFQGERWILDGSCRVLEPYDGQRLIELRGITPSGTAQGSRMETEETVKLENVSMVLTAMIAQGITENVTWLDVSNVGAIKFDYLGRFTVDVGSGESADYKLVKLVKVVEKLEEDERGRIDVSRDESRSSCPTDVTVGKRSEDAFSLFFTGIDELFSKGL